jgi:hypothetical protein
MEPSNHESPSPIDPRVPESPEELALGAASMGRERSRATPRKLVPRIILAVLGGLAGWNLAGHILDEPESAVPTATHETAFIEYSNSQYRFSLSYPSNWTRLENQYGAIVFFASPLDGPSDAFSENLSVGIENVGKATSLDEYEIVGLKQAPKAFLEFDLVSSELVGLTGRPAYEDHYVARLSQGEIEGLQVTMLVGTKVYLITFTGESGEGFDSWLPTAREIIDSFTLEGK